MVVEFLPCGDTGLSIQFGEVIDRDLSQRILNLRTVVDDARLPGVVETVPTYRSLMIHYDPLLTSQANLVDVLKPLLDGMNKKGDVAKTHWRLPVCFDGKEFALDLNHVAEWSNMSPGDVVDILTSLSLYVYMIGFAPGQPHLGDLPDSLAIPRRKDPVPGVPKGSLVTAAGLAVIYPFSNPTGWHIIGRSPIPLFDVRADDPVLLKPGDTVSFFSVEQDEYHAISAQISAETYEVERSAAT